MSPAELAAIRDRYDRGVCSERDIAALLAEVERLSAKVAKVARWESEPYRYPSIIRLMGNGNRRVADISCPRPYRPSWRASWGASLVEFPTEAGARAYIEAEAKRRGWWIQP